MAIGEKEVKDTQKILAMVDGLVTNAVKALDELRSYDQTQIDTIVKDMAMAGLEQHKTLAKLAIEETKRGVFEDKVFKNMFATEYIFDYLKDMKTVGVINENVHEGMVEIAEPVGVIAGIVPVTNPTSTALFKSLISIKTRNPIIFAFHPLAQKSSSAAARTMLEAAIRAGAPKNCIQWIEVPSLDAVQMLMRHPKVSLILATGGAGLVKAAYSSGKPALGVGPGNVPCYFEKTANVKRAVNDLILSKTFDNGMICASEQAIVIDQNIYEEVKDEMTANNCYFLNDVEIQKLEKLAIDEKSCALNPIIVGLSAYNIAKMAGVKVPKATKILVAELQGVGPKHPLSCEKLSPILACYKAESTEEGFTIAEAILEYGGLGHSAVIHSENQSIIDDYALRMKASRIIVNTPSTQGAIGNIYNTYLPSLTLGCGTYGGNSISTNVGAVHLINIKKMAKRSVNTQWFKVPSSVFFEKNSVQQIATLPRLSKVFIVTSPSSIRNKYVDKVIHYLRKNPGFVSYEVFSDVEPDPSNETVMLGAEMMRKSKPDAIIALGGGSVIDAAKAMWLFYEHPHMSFEQLKLKFLNPSTRVVQVPPLGAKAMLVAIPTTSGTGSEITAFSVITDKHTHTKYPIADFNLTPNVAIIDPQFTLTVPAHITADTGMDVLTHAIEAYVSVLASDYTDGLAMKAIELVFDYLPKAYQDGNNEKAREKMHNASSIAGMAFANAFLGVNHSLAHAVGSEFQVAHGRANAILLPYVIRYNAEKPNKFMTFPKYEHFIADERYCEIATKLGLPARTSHEGVESLAKAVKQLSEQLGIPTSFKDLGISETEFMSKLNVLAELAFDDQDTLANPKQPSIAELAEILKSAYNGV
ncbi:bifunctional acetaldehyde-CoA/alcohol dehydrogenase [Bacillus sp. HMF5848]|uniref:bifunctional acetaldehyde-CoA/alcohol dehydrogenase n=1 Tax=Bacillus sp. HMF5848 TaxID=2495421 RepID=UPI000F782A43|nr:bifunctional acetaldehyde-CoA/alcohol dehydrogenase [Bacillus sp. HMF5848]RSK26792.1 bifunctional acetaldehyde-CoA/alcohol dehydrogenase [Bacillus sp. HMF5848]